MATILDPNFKLSLFPEGKDDGSFQTITQRECDDMLSKEFKRVSQDSSGDSQDSSDSQDSGPDTAIQCTWRMACWAIRTRVSTSSPFLQEGDDGAVFTFSQCTWRMAGSARSLNSSCC